MRVNIAFSHLTRIDLGHERAGQALKETSGAWSNQGSAAVDVPIPGLEGGPIHAPHPQSGNGCEMVA